MLFHMYLTPVTKILIPVTKKQTLHIKQRTLKPLACTATQSQARTIYTATKNLYNETTEQQTKQIGNILSFLPEKNGLLQPITYTYTQKSSGRNSRFCRKPSKLAASYSPTFAVPSAQTGLTSLFGRGRGGTPPP